MLGPRFCVRAFSSCGERRTLFIVVRGPLTVVASLVAEHRLQTRRLSSCSSRAQLLRGMWDPPTPGLEPVSPALAGGFSTTAPPGKHPPGFLTSDMASVSALLFEPRPLFLWVTELSSLHGEGLGPQVLAPFRFFHSLMSQWRESDCSPLLYPKILPESFKWAILLTLRL